MTLAISDPRQFSKIYPDSNMLINQAQHDIANGESNDLMCALIADLLKQNQDQTLSVAYNLAPDFSIANYIWNSLQDTVNSHSEIKQTIFAFPIVFVVGSKANITLNKHFDVDKLKQILLEKQMISNEDCVISNQLYDIATLAKVKPSSLYKALRNDFNLQLGVDLLEPSLFTNQGENVHLRFILASTKSSNLSIASFEKISMEFMQLITDSVKREDATIFPIPFAPCDLSNATVIGERYYQEIALTFKLSNLVKNLRLNGKNPVVKLSTEQNKIQIAVINSRENKLVDTIAWYLQPVDNFDEVCMVLETLFADMQLNVIYTENIT
ncbi:MAG: hypothetical protein PHC75_04595 [Burkholderiales bacterium]|nr:hypothetical protein [Burkholderiales bacterium]